MIVRNAQRALPPVAVLPTPQQLETMIASIATLQGEPDPEAAPAPDLTLVRLSPVSIVRLIEWAAFETGLHATAITGQSRERRIFRVRAAVAWVAWAGLGRGPTAIGRAIGDRDHSTIIASLRTAERLRGCDPAFQRLTGRLLDLVEQATERHDQGDNA